MTEKTFRIQKAYRGYKGRRNLERGKLDHDGARVGSGRYSAAPKAQLF